MPFGPRYGEGLRKLMIEVGTPVSEICFTSLFHRVGRRVGRIGLSLEPENRRRRVHLRAVKANELIRTSRLDIPIPVAESWARGGSLIGSQSLNQMTSSNLDKRWILRK